MPKNGFFEIAPNVGTQKSTPQIVKILHIPVYTGALEEMPDFLHIWIPSKLDFHLYSV